MNFLLFIPFLYAKEIIEFPELEKRSADDICQEYQTNYVWKRQNPCYTAGEGCTYGTHSQEDIEWTGKRVNFFRKLTGLSQIPLTTNAHYLNLTNQASLVMDKNHVFSHYLNNESLECWSPEAKEGASSSNIYASSGTACSTDSINAYMDDSGTTGLGHRRWILNPPLTQVVSGVAGQYSALLTIGIDNGTETISKFLAYPPPGPVPSDLIFGHWSFSRNYTKMWSDEHDKMPEDTQIRIKCNDTVQTLKPSFSNSNPAMYPGMVEFQPGQVPAGTYCKVIVSSDSLDIEWRYTVLSVKCVDGKAENVNNDAYNGKDDGYGFEYDTKKKKSGSSHKDSDDDKQTSARKLGDFRIESVYLGASPNIYFNFNIFVTLMKKARETFGHIIPSPDFVHTAIWVGKEGATDDSVGSIFVYGKYKNKNNYGTYINGDGAKAYVMTLGEFKERYPSVEPIKLNTQGEMKLFDFIEKVKTSGKWHAKDYNWPTNNCQHFNAKLIDILKATRDSPDNDDWVNIPKPILNSLKLNEEVFKKL